MGLLKSKIQQELKDLRDKREELKRKIQALESYLGITEGSTGSTASIRGAGDIRPTVKAVFEERHNEPLSPKEIVDAVSEKQPDMSKDVIKKKMVNVTRTMLKSPGYGRWQLKDESS